MQKIVAAALSGILLFCSFPPLEYFAFAWIALIPLIYLCFSGQPGESFLYGLLSGAVFWLGTIFWLTRVSFIGWFFVGLYCAFYFALFAMVVSWWYSLYRNFKVYTFNPGFPIESGMTNLKKTRQKRISFLSFPRKRESRKNMRGFNLIFLFGVPAIWVGFEYARAHFLTGFPWNLLGVSQYSCVNLIQCAEWGGVYLISYLIIMGNTALALMIDSCNERNIKRWRASNKERLDQEKFVIPDLIGNPDSSATDGLDSRLRGNDRSRTLWEVLRDGIIRTGIVLVFFLLILFLALEHGRRQLAQAPEKLETIRAATVQPNVPQQLKWSDEWADDIYRRLKESTAEACRPALPDLIVWPETALPDFVRSSGPSRTLVNDSRRYGVPLLVGSMDLEELPEKTNYFNSSFLFLPGPGRPCSETQRILQGRPQVYAKRHLVLFGEYVPLANYFPFLRSISGIEEDFMPGKENVVFRLNGGGRKFSVLICFEDTLPYLARECVRAGARLLINQTNDAWFDPSWASRQHMTHCVFRCIENRVACLRATNTGLTCYIDRFGLIRSSLPPQGSEPCSKAQRILQGSPCSEALQATLALKLRNEPAASPRRERILQGEPQVMRSEVKFSPENMPLTFYTRHGDVLAIACAAFSLPLFIGTLLGFLRKRY